MLKYARKQMKQRLHKPLAKHGNETMSHDSKKELHTPPKRGDIGSIPIRGPNLKAPCPGCQCGRVKENIMPPLSDSRETSNLAGTGSNPVGGANDIHKPEAWTGSASELKEYLSVLWKDAKVISWPEL